MCIEQRYYIELNRRRLSTFWLDASQLSQTKQSINPATTTTYRRMKNVVCICVFLVVGLCWCWADMITLYVCRGCWTDLDPDTNAEEEEEKRRLINQVLELQNTLDGDDFFAKFSIYVENVVYSFKWGTVKPGFFSVAVVGCVKRMLVGGPCVRWAVCGLDIVSFHFFLFLSFCLPLVVCCHEASLRRC